MKPLYAVAAVLFMSAVLVLEEAVAIPAFARKYDMSCMTCHAPFPKLKPYGADFAANGYQLADKDAPRFLRDTGDDWLLLMRELPVALRFELYGRFQSIDETKADLQTPYILKILSGGQIARDVSYYFYFFFSERGEVAGIEDAFLSFNNIFSAPLDLAVGQFQVSDPLFKRELRMTFEDYQIYRFAPGHSSVDLAYDRGLYFTYALPTATDLSFLVVNGSGIGPADASRAFDSDRYKNVMLRISQDVGELLRVGVFGYVGKEEGVGAMEGGTEAPARTNAMWMLGPDVTLSTENLEVNVQYVERQDEDPFFAGADEKTKTRGGFAEVVYTPNGDQSRYYGVLLYNWLESLPGGAKVNSLTGHLSYMIARNLRLTGEYTYDFALKGGTVTVGLVSAF